MAYSSLNLAEAALADLKQDLNKQINETESHLSRLRTLLSELEEQNTQLQELNIASIQTEKL